MKTIAHQAFRLALFNLALQATLGLLLRFLVWHPVPGLVYKNLLFAHSHFGLGGWVFTALFSLLLAAFCSDKELNTQPYRFTLIAAQIGNYGMLLSFPFQGYGPVSIAFSQLYILSSYVFAWLLYRHTKSNRRLSVQCLRVALFLLVLSSIGPYVLGFLMAKKITDPAITNNIVYFYLHFQYNGWFVFALLALGIRLLENFADEEALVNAYHFYHLQLLAVVPAYLLSVLWAHPPVWVYTLAALAATLQLVSLYYLFKVLRKSTPALAQQTRTIRALTTLAIASFAVKNLLQFLSALPSVADLAYRYRPFIIAYLHLVLVGTVSFALLARFVGQKYLQTGNWLTAALLLFTGGYLLTQGLLVSEGLYNWLAHGSIPHLPAWLFYGSLALPAGAILLHRALQKERLT